MQTAPTLLVLGVILVAGTPLRAAEPQETPGTSGSKMGADRPPFKAEEIDAMLAPIALHPDDLLSQILMASTYPIEIVQADRWVKANPNMKGEALAKELEKQTWDPSVRSLVNFPQVLTMMSEKLDWTVNLGNAFLGQQKEVMEAIQKLRTKAKAAGNLESSKEQKVETKTEEGKEVIVIEPAEKEVIYVPTYNPTVIYGSWPYPAYPPYYWYPPAYVPPPYPAFHFSMGFAMGVAWGYAWGGCHWGHSEVDIDIDRNVERNRNIDRGKHAQQLQDRGGLKNGKGNWKHDPSHRQGAAYRDSATAKKFGGATPSDTARARESYRGRTDASASPGVSDRAGDRSTSRAPDRATATDRPASTNRASTDRGNAFDSVKQGGSSTRAASDRGRSSRSASPSSGARSRGGGGRGGRRG